MAVTLRIDALLTDVPSVRPAPTTTTRLMAAAEPRAGEHARRRGRHGVHGNARDVRTAYASNRYGYCRRPAPYRRSRAHEHSASPGQ